CESYVSDKPKLRVDEGYPKNIKVWDGLEIPIDAAYTDLNGNLYFFKGKIFWKLDDKNLSVLPGYPKNIGKDWLNCASDVEKNSTSGGSDCSPDIGCLPSYLYVIKHVCLHGAYDDMGLERTGSLRNHNIRIGVGTLVACFFDPLGVTKLLRVDVAADEVAAAGDDAVDVAAVPEISEFVKRYFRNVQQWFSANFANRWVLRSSLNFVSDGELVRESEKEVKSSREKGQKNKCRFSKRVFKKREQEDNCKPGLLGSINISNK
ncbi:hypothetical protein HELRODRAFT_184203, partial [Helobdella robusta]|uniref:Uncharacterized protein n=1 Tax=Helobdella robusta TaxID=6412 RepID=T1FKR5_HELRO